MRDFVDRELIPIEMEAMDGPVMRPDVRARLEQKAKDLGLWLLEVPQEYGGQGLSMLGMVVVWQEIARTIAMPPRGPAVFGPEIRGILFTLNDAQKEQYLFPVLRGEKTTAFAQSEPDAGADPACPAVQPRPAGSGVTACDGARRRAAVAISGHRARQLRLV